MFEHSLKLKKYHKQESVPVGCVSSAAVTIGWWGGVPAHRVYLLGSCTCQGGVYLPVWGVYLPRGCTCWRVCIFWRDVPARGVPCLGVYLPGGVYPSMHWSRHPPVNRMTDRCENIIFPQLRLQMVIK